jgi:cell volume regulation protein A
VPAAARLLRVPMRPVEPEPWALGVRLRDEPSGACRLTVTAGSSADGRTVDELAGLPGQAWVSFIVRDGQLVPVKGGTKIRAGDDILVLADPALREEVLRVFTAPPVKSPRAGGQIR